MDISEKKLRSELEKLAAPVDFDDLEEKGIMVKKGAWYKITNIHELPESVSSKITEVKTESNGSTFVKLNKSTEKAESMLKKLKQI